MSLTKNKAIRCDWCGKLTRDKNGEYRKADGTAGYILQPEWERFPAGDMTSKNQIQSSNDICEECAENRCPGCGSADIVEIHPTRPGPDGWAARCKACSYYWPRFPNKENEVDAETRCSACGSDNVSLLTPSTCNPARFAIQCKTCNHIEWQAANGCPQTEEERDAENH